MSTSPAAAPALDVNDLNFDTCERLRHLDWLLNQLGADDGANVLDAGGYPCYMARAFPQRRVVTADIYASGHPPYVKASGAALPFADNTFDVTIACDVLEHVPPVHRGAFLTELARVSSRAVIVAGPYTTPGAARAEAMVRTLLPESSPAQVWLAEHTECGLPSIDESMENLRATGAADVQALPVGSLTEWILFFAAQAVGERDHQVAGAVKQFIAQYNRLHTQPGISNVAPAYRHAIVAAMDRETEAALKRLVSSSVTGESSRQFDLAEVEAYVDALGGLLKATLTPTPWSTTTATDGAAVVRDTITDEYINRLEVMLSHRGIPLPPHGSAGSTTSGGNNIMQRLRAAWQILRG